MHGLLKALNSGGVGIYPTETLYAIGCDATCQEACERVASIKDRSKGKPLPLIIGGTDMLDMVTNEKTDSISHLAEVFWPGPLSILVKALPELPDMLSDEDGYTSVRLSGHPFAAELSRRMKRPLVATSANFSSKPPVGLPEDLDHDLLEQVDEAYLDPPWPRGQKPSTVVRLLSASQVEILREGAVTVKMLCDKGYSVSVNTP
ncbi:threonylcarbamoyl-AMP synthase [Pseudodesulfovibrio sp. JC047]|uniref:L-threonylcarbamoyladenylate synthase n=1 Tax=Pseudodesulfovibrio sp. JC047 TaxID=2683199 RepID=UPI0013D1A0FF|nr:L-threonylcarbamoyladenylate synthase [Pseudodesulfovibrio sp. JC047]NDV17979.1 threonylcarbamoyl-AMP synthase [Pseudodesulfovibrio sp. JC047]